jgi:sialate O-acetylesterase
MRNWLAPLCVVALCALNACSIPPSETVELPGYFTDHMVLQRDQPLPIKGKGDPGKGITVEFSGQKVSAKVDAEGNWSATLQPMPASAEPQILKINHVTLNDILVGDVWVCSGQSNMEWPLNRTLNFEEEAAKANFPTIRHLKIKHLHETTPQPDVKAEWKVCNPENAPEFTAVGYYFARRLTRELDIPIGLIGSNWGGTRIEPWIPAEAFETQPELADLVEEAKNPKPIKKGEKRTHQRSTLIYNAMIHPLLDYPIKGAIWYQGESNGNPTEADAYLPKKKALIGGWRQAWNVGDFPFYFVQLANFRESQDDPAGGDGYAPIRESQRRALKIPNTGMATIIDIGEAKDIHPKNKQDVGYRLAQWALAQTYGKDIVPSGPMFKELKIEGDKARAIFDHVGSGLMIGKKEIHKPYEPVQEVKDGKLAEFAISGEDGTWHWADAVIDGDTVVVSSPEVKKPVAVRYAYRMNPDRANLYNKEGLPASPFRSDK